MKKDTRKIRIAIVTEYPVLARKFFSKYKNNIQIVNDDPDIVVSFGGDGTFFKSEFLYKSVPKLYLKYSRIGKLANPNSNTKLINSLIKGKYKILEKTKLEVSFKNKKMFAMADVLIHNHNPFTAVRMKVFVDGKQIEANEIIGDGVLVSTQIGSTGYYKSITRSYFESDDQIGLAFNNAIDQVSHIVLKKDRVIKIEITRGIADIYADNQDQKWELDTGDILEIKASKDKMKMVNI